LAVTELSTRYVVFDSLAIVRTDMNSILCKAKKKIKTKQKKNPKNKETNKKQMCVHCHLLKKGSIGRIYLLIYLFYFINFKLTWPESSSELF
jgi:hypothetical protein